jgi:hypothetical protein
MPVKRTRGPVESSVVRAISEAEIEERDKATAELARQYALSIDHGGDVVKLGPLLLSVLESLNMSPRARAVGTKGVTTSDNKPSTLDQLAERRARKSRAEDLDASTS